MATSFLHRTVCWDDVLHGGHPLLRAITLAPKSTSAVPETNELQDTGHPAPVHVRVWPLLSGVREQLAVLRSLPRWIGKPAIARSLPRWIGKPAIARARCRYDRPPSKRIGDDSLVNYPPHIRMLYLRSGPVLGRKPCEDLHLFIPELCKAGKLTGGSSVQRGTALLDAEHRLSPASPPIPELIDDPSNFGDQAGDDGDSDLFSQTLCGSSLGGNPLSESPLAGYISTILANGFPVQTRCVHEERVAETGCAAISEYVFPAYQIATTDDGKAVTVTVATVRANILTVRHKVALSIHDAIICDCEHFRSSLWQPGPTTAATAGHCLHTDLYHACYVPTQHGEENMYPHMRAYADALAAGDHVLTQGERGPCVRCYGVDGHRILLSAFPAEESLTNTSGNDQDISGTVVGSSAQSDDETDDHVDDGEQGAQGGGDDLPFEFNQHMSVRSSGLELVDLKVTFVEEHLQLKMTCHGSACALKSSCDLKYRSLHASNISGTEASPERLVLPVRRVARNKFAPVKVCLHTMAAFEAYSRGEFDQEIVIAKQRARAISTSANSVAGSNIEDFDENAQIYTLHFGSFSHTAHGPCATPSTHPTPGVEAPAAGVAEDLYLCACPPILDVSVFEEFCRTWTLPKIVTALNERLVCDLAAAVKDANLVTNERLVAGPEFKVLATVCSKCNGPLGSDEFDAKVTLYAQMAPYSCKFFKKTCQEEECGCQTRVLCEQGVFRVTSVSAFTLGVYLEHCRAVVTTRRGCAFTTYANHLEARYTETLGLRSFADLKLFIRFWFAATSTFKINYPLKAQCPAHADGPCPIVMDGNTLGPSAGVTGLQDLHPLHPSPPTGVLLKKVIFRRHFKSPIPCPQPKYRPADASGFCAPFAATTETKQKAEALRTAIGGLAQHLRECVSRGRHCLGVDQDKTYCFCKLPGATLIAHIETCRSFAESDTDDCWLTLGNVQHVCGLQEMCKVLVDTLSQLTPTGNLRAPHHGAQYALKLSTTPQLVKELQVTASYIQLYSLESSVTAICQPRHAQRLRELATSARASGSAARITALTKFVHDKIQNFELASVLTCQYIMRGSIQPWVWQSVSYLVARVEHVDKMCMSEDAMLAEKFNEHEHATAADGFVRKRNPPKTGSWHYLSLTGHQIRHVRHFKDDTHVDCDDSPHGAPCFKPGNRAAAAKKGTHLNHFSGYCPVSQMYRGGHFIRGSEGETNLVNMYAHLFGRLELS